MTPQRCAFAMVSGSRLLCLGVVDRRPRALATGQSGRIGKTYFVFLFWILAQPGPHPRRTPVHKRRERACELPRSAPRHQHVPARPVVAGTVGTGGPAVPRAASSAAADAVSRDGGSARAADWRLAPDSPYHRTVRPGLWPALKSIVLDREAAALSGDGGLCQPAGKSARLSMNVWYHSWEASTPTMPSCTTVF